MNWIWSKGSDGTVMRGRTLKYLNCKRFNKTYRYELTETWIYKEDQEECKSVLPK
jgi:hypothetical protein